MPFSIFTDTSAWYAYLDRDDADHDLAVNIVQNLSRPLITSNFIIDEILTLAKMRLGFDIAAIFGEKLWNQEIASLIKVTDIDETQAWNIFLKYKDKGFSFTDCTSFALMERLGIATAFTFDGHFAQYGRFVIIPAP